MSCLISFGGGQIPESNKFIASTAISLLRSDSTSHVYGMHRSFAGMMNSDCFEELTLEKATKMMFSYGTYLGTCRNVRLTKEDFPKIKEQFDKLGITTLYMIGGDGSMRATFEMNKYFKDTLTIKFIPATVDGINGSDESTGFKSAVAETYKITELMAADCFSIYDPTFYGKRVAIVEVQGRNRNDILLAVTKMILKAMSVGNTPLENLNLIIIPCGYNWTTEDLLNRVNRTENDTLVVVSEGAKPHDNYMKRFGALSIGMQIESAIRTVGIRDARTQVVGYLTQMNDVLFPMDVDKEVRSWVKYAIAQNGTGVVAKRNGHFTTASFKDMIDLNPNSSDPVCITPEEEKLIKSYLL